MLQNAVAGVSKITQKHTKTHKYTEIKKLFLFVKGEYEKKRQARMTMRMRMKWRGEQKRTQRDRRGQKRTTFFSLFLIAVLCRTSASIEAS